MPEEQRPGDWVQRGAWFVCFLACGLLVLVVFGQYYPVLSGLPDIAGRAALALVLLIATWVSRRSERLRRYWPVWFAFFVACAALSLDYYLDLSRWLLPLLHVDLRTPAGQALNKLESSLLSVLVILVLTRASGAKLASLRLVQGNLRLGLIVGLAAWAVFLASAIPLAESLFTGRDLRWGCILPWMPWVLVFVLSNAFNEELLFRGLFFDRFEPFLGRFLTNLVMAVPFALMHTGVQYAPDMLVFMGLLFCLSLAWGALAQKTGSLWGPILFHAATDIPVVLAIYSNL